MKITKTILANCMKTALTMTLFGMVLQVAKGQLILKLPPPNLGFIISAAFSYILLGFLYAFAFSIFKNALPGQTPVKKGLFYSLLCSIVVLIPGIMGVIAYDFDGQFNMLTPYKIEQYLTCLIDVMNLGVGGLLLSKLFKDDIVISESANTPKKRLVFSSLIAAVILPLLMLSIHLLAESFFPIGLDIPKQAKEWYYIALISPLVLTGGFLPLFYHSVKDALSGNWALKSVKFFLVFYLCFWFINIGFLVNFGFSVHYVCFLLAISIPSLLSTIMLNGMMLETDHKEMRFCAEEKGQ